MKQILKGSAPEFFKTFLKKKHPKTWEELGVTRKELREHILQEQRNCCAYTELRLNGEADCHIDHYHTRNLFPQQTFDYENLLVSCNSEEYAAKFKDKQIKSKEAYSNLINPAKEQPTDFIEFAFTGEVLALDKNLKGENTIIVFNLNEKSLLERRKTVARTIIAMRGILSEQELVEAIGEFETMIRQLYRDVTT